MLKPAILQPVSEMYESFLRSKQEFSWEACSG